MHRKIQTEQRLTESKREPIRVHKDGGFESISQLLNRKSISCNTTLLQSHSLLQILFEWIQAPHFRGVLLLKYRYVQI